MEKLVYPHETYLSKAHPPSFLAKTFPSLTFYAKFLKCVFKASSLAKQGKYNGEAWAQSSFDLLQALEQAGVIVEIRGIEHVMQLEGPCVFIGNHMSMLETMVLPAIIQPIKDVTFVVKESLLDYPIFKHIMRTRNPVAVTRKNPRLDLKAILEGGTERLRTGQSIIVFPQTTRSDSFDPEQFNTIGVKLAKKADVPVIPLALVTDAWQNGRYLKDFGKINPAKKVLFAFGSPLRVAKRTSETHAQVLGFIQDNILEEQQSRDGSKPIR